MKRHLSAITLQLLMGAVSTAWAQTALNLEQCLHLARSNSPALHIADDAVRTAGLARSELWTTALPQLKGSIEGVYAPMPPTFGYDAVVSNGGQLAGQIILQQSLYDGGSRSLKSDQLQLDSDRLVKERRRVDRDLVFTVKQAFTDVLRAQEETELQKQSVDQLTTYLELVRKLFNGGTASYTDLLKTEVQLSNASLELQKATETAQSARSALAEVIGTELDSTVSVVGSLESPPDSTLAGIPAGPASGVDLAIAGLEIERSRLDVELTKRERFPSISFTGDAGYLSSVENLQLPSAERVTGIGYSVGVGIEVPIINWGATGLRVEQRELQLDAVKQETELLRRSLNGELQRTRLGLLNARNRLQTVRSNVKKSEDNFLLARSKYAGGAALSLEVLSAQQLLTEAKLAELETLSAIQHLSAKLEQLTTQ